MARNFAREKRCLKRSMKIMLTLCISFFVFTGCGIPSYFYMYEGSSGTSSSYYNFTTSDDDSDYLNNYELEFSISIGGDTNSSVSEVDGVSLVYLYTIVSKNLDYSDISTDFISSFESDYINDNTGRPISSSTDVVASTTYDGNTYNLYKFQIYDNDGNDINKQIPTSYGLTLLDSPVDYDEVYTTNFGFKYGTDDSTYCDLLLDQIDIDNFSATGDNTVKDNISLRDYNGAKFLQNWDGITDGYENIDSGVEYKIIIYTALNVSNGEDFTNIFWSTLHEVAEISSVD